MNNKLIPYTNQLIKKYGLSIKSNVNVCLCSYIEAIIFNIVTIASIITFINNCKSINKETLYILKEYIHQTCGKTSMKGGGGAVVLPSEFYGTNSGNYAPTNNQVDLLSINFASNTIRPQIGGGKIEKTPIVSIIKKFLHYFHLRASSDIIKEIVNIIDNYVNCLMNKLKQVSKGKSLSTSTIKKVIKSGKVFNIFK
jgi:histone H3/H4